MDDQAEYKIEYNWSVYELSSAQINLMYHWTGDERAVATENEWKAYMCALRDYASTNSEGGYSIVDVSENTYTYDNAEYTITIDGDTGRPVAPSNE